MVKKFDPSATANRLAKHITEAQPGEKIIDIPLKAITNDPNQHRKHFDQAKLEQLGVSIKATGQEQPIVVRPNSDPKVQYMIVFGERRWRASQLVGLKTIKAIIRQLTDDDVRAIVNAQAAENWQREGLTAKETVELAQRVIAENGGLAEAVATSGKPKALLSKLSGISKGGEAIQTCLNFQLCEDIEALYRLVRASKKDQHSVDRLVQKWVNQPESRTNQRGQVDQLLARLDAVEADTNPTIPTTEPAEPSVPKNGKSQEPNFAETVSSVTHGSGDAPAVPVTPSATGGSVATPQPSLPVALAQRVGKSVDDADGVQPEAGGPVFRCLSANFESQIVVITTDSGDFRFDRSTLAEVLGLDS